MFHHGKILQNSVLLLCLSSFYSYVMSFFILFIHLTFPFSFLSFSVSFFFLSFFFLFFFFLYSLFTFSFSCLSVVFVTNMSASKQGNAMQDFAKSIVRSLLLQLFVVPSVGLFFDHLYVSVNIFLCGCYSLAIEHTGLNEGMRMTV